MTESAPRDRCRLPAPSRCLDGRVATSVATAARIAAADSGLPRGGELSPALFTRTRRFAQHSRQSGASSPRPWCHTRTLHRLRAPTNGSLHRPLLHRQVTKKTTTTKKKGKTTTTDREDRLGVLRALISLLVYRSALLPAPVGSFQKGGVTHFQRLAPMNRPMTNDHPFAACGKNRRENPRAIGIPSCFSLAFSESLVPFAL